MARIIRLSATGPIKVEPQDKAIFICACGLTKNAPFCDGSHKKSRDEPEGKCFVYNPDLERTEVAE